MSHLKITSKPGSLLSSAHLLARKNRRFIHSNFVQIYTCFLCGFGLGRLQVVGLLRLLLISGRCHCCWLSLRRRIVGNGRQADPRVRRDIVLNGFLATMSQKKGKLLEDLINGCYTASVVITLCPCRVARRLSRAGGAERNWKRR